MFAANRRTTVTLDCSTIDDSVSRSARQAREVDMLTRRIQQAHPDVRPTTLTALVEQAYSELAESRVQSYRSILTERVVRLRLEEPTLILNVDEGGPAGPTRRVMSRAVR
jgi:hypothetical protein